MRFLVKVVPDPVLVNKSLQDGSFGPQMHRILSELQPEAAYFTEVDGRRTAVLVVDLAEINDLTKVGEPFFNWMNAQVHFHPAMTREDLAQANLHDLARKWSGA